MISLLQIFIRWVYNEQETMIRNYLVKYQQLPVFSQEQILEKGQKIIYYDELIIDFSDFQHPGSNKLLIDFQGRNIQLAYQSQNHSYNAGLMLMNLTIGRTTNKPGKGFQLWDRVLRHRMVEVHENVLKKIDFSKGILNQLKLLDAQQVKSFVTIPKSFDNTKDIKFYDDKWTELWFRDHFWLSTTIFTFLMLLVCNHLYQRSQFFNDYICVILFGIGAIKWTAIQYYFHRFELHYDLSTNNRQLGGHYLHHAFPNIKDKIALSITKNISYQIIFYVVYTTILGLNSIYALHLLLGLHITMTIYDCLHYYFHFGPQVNIPILLNLKRSHLKHHYRDMNNNFGVTNTIWDNIFRSISSVK